MAGKSVFLRNRAARRLLRDLQGVGFTDLEVSDVVGHFDRVVDWKRGGLSRDELGLLTGWGERGYRTLTAARALHEAKRALGAAMARDYRMGRGEEEIVAEAAFVIPLAEGRRLLHDSRLLHDALAALQPWTRVFLMPHGVTATRQGMAPTTICVQWKGEDEAARRQVLGGLDEALRAVGIGYRDCATKAPLNEASLAGWTARSFWELYWLDAPHTLESATE
ncbi:hypothetical protein ACFY1P_20245 [Streptomyces sp. NPDC001407]|uniref:hypothetical protein n=1 Tax=Streptomyces sp. NPDC001407 TaxID=3364573 RepID=UPI0036BDF73A